MNKFQTAFIPAAFLVLALAPLPYGFYTLLRFIVASWALYVAWTEYQRAQSANAWVVGFAIIAALFNPLVPIYLSREIWAVLDLACVAAFAAYGIRKARGPARYGG